MKINFGVYTLVLKPTLALNERFGPIFTPWELWFSLTKTNNNTDGYDMSHLKRRAFTEQ